MCVCLTYLRKHYCSNERASAWCLWSVVSREQSYGKSWPCGLAVSHRTAKTRCLRGPHTAPQTTCETAIKPAGFVTDWCTNGARACDGVQSADFLSAQNCYQIFRISLNDAVHTGCISVKISHEHLTSQACDWACLLAWPSKKSSSKKLFQWVHM